MPKCLECKEDVIYRSEQEWYIRKMEDEEKLKQAFDNIISKLSGCKDAKKNNIKEKLYDSIKTKEMLISNESAFGTPIPVFYCAECSSEVMNDRVISILKNLFKTKGIESWYKETPEEILQGQVICDKCGCSFLFKGTTTLNEFFKLMCVPIQKNNKDIDANMNEINICIENEDYFIKKIKTLSFDDKSLFEMQNINKILLHPKIRIAENKIKLDEIAKDKEDKGAKKDKKDKKDKNKKEDTLNSKTDAVFDMQTVVKDYGTDVLRLWCVQKSLRRKSNFK